MAEHEQRNLAAGEFAKRLGGRLKLYPALPQSLRLFAAGSSCIDLDVPPSDRDCGVRICLQVERPVRVVAAAEIHCRQRDGLAGAKISDAGGAPQPRATASCR